MINFQDQYQKKSFFSSRIFFLLVILLIVLIIFGLVSLLFRKNNFSGEASQENKIAKQVNPLQEIIPQQATSSEDFLKQVKVKSDKLQKEYNDNLTEFAQNRWEDIFQLVNKNEFDLASRQFEIKESGISQDEEGNKIFRIKYSFDAGKGSQEAEDWFYLLISQKRKDELGLSSLNSDSFLSENQLLANIGQKDLIHITKIEKSTDKLPK